MLELTYLFSMVMSWLHGIPTSRPVEYQLHCLPQRKIRWSWYSNVLDPNGPHQRRKLAELWQSMGDKSDSHVHFRIGISQLRIFNVMYRISSNRGLVSNTSSVSYRGNTVIDREYYNMWQIFWGGTSIDWENIRGFYSYYRSLSVKHSHWPVTHPIIK